MTAHQQINAIASAVHVLEMLASTPVKDATDAEATLRADAYVAATALGDKLRAHFDSGGMTEQEWDATASLEDYAQEENKAIIAAVAKES